MLPNCCTLPFICFLLYSTFNRTTDQNRCKIFLYLSGSNSKVTSLGFSVYIYVYQVIFVAVLPNCSGVQGKSRIRSLLVKTVFIMTQRLSNAAFEQVVTYLLTCEYTRQSSLSRWRSIGYTVVMSQVQSVAFL